MQRRVDIPVRSFRRWPRRTQWILFANGLHREILLPVSRVFRWSEILGPGSRQAGTAMHTAEASSLLALALFSLSWPSGVSWRVLLPKNVTFDSMRDIENEVDVFAFGGNHQGQVVPGTSLQSPRFLDRNLDTFFAAGADGPGRASSTNGRTELAKPPLQQASQNIYGYSSYAPAPARLHLPTLGRTTGYLAARFTR